MRYVFDHPVFEPDGKPTPDLAADFEVVDHCPICASGNLTPLFVVTGSDGSTGNRGAYCNDCEHTFKSRRPSTRWYAEYYHDDWDTRTPTKAPSRTVKQQLRSHVRSLVIPSRLISFYDRDSASGHVKGMRILPMLTGIATGDSYGLRPDPSVRSVLEIGCGYGSALELFEQIGLRAVGLETSRARAEACVANGLTVTNCSIEDAATGMSGEPFDLLYSAHVFEHILSPAQALRSIGSLVREGGFIYIEVPGVNEGEGLIKFAHEVTHVQAFSMASLAQLLIEAGFRPIRMRTGVTLHIVGVKEKPRGPKVRGFADCESLTRGADRISRSGRVNVGFNHRELVVSAEDGTPIHTDKVYFSRQDTPLTTVGAVLEPGAGVLDLCSPGPAPVWIKRQ